MSMLHPLDFTIFTTDMKKIFKMGFILNGDADLPNLGTVDSAQSKKTTKITKETQALVQAIGLQLVIKLCSQDLPKTQPANRGRDDSETGGSTLRKLSSFRNAVTFAAVVYDLSFIRTTRRFFVPVDSIFEEILGGKWKGEWQNALKMHFPDLELVLVAMQQAPLDFDASEEKIYASESNFVQSMLNNILQWEKQRQFKASQQIHGWGEPVRSSGMGAAVTTTRSVQTKSRRQILGEMEVNNPIVFGKTPAAMVNIREALKKIFKVYVNRKSDNTEILLQQALNEFFEESTLKFGPDRNLVVRSNTQLERKMRDNHDEVELMPDLAVFIDGLVNAMGRNAVIELKRSSETLDKHLTQLVGYLTGMFDENPLRKKAFGIITNEKDFELHEMRAVEGSYALQHFRLYKSNSAAATVGAPTAADCIVWLLNHSAEELGFARWPQFKLDGKDHTLGRLIGNGESCGVYTVVPVDDRTKNGSSPFVLKVYLSKTRADHEREIYKAAEKVPHTTKLLKIQPASLPDRVLAVTPYAEFFAPKGDGKNKEKLPDISVANVDQLATALKQLHNAGVVHCDIHFSNIFCSRAAPHEALLNDFGRSRLRETMNFCNFRILAQNDWDMLASAISNARGGTVAWNSVFAPPNIQQQNQQQLPQTGRSGTKQSNKNKK